MSYNGDKIDMSLDDIIKARAKQNAGVSKKKKKETETKKKTAGRQNQRVAATGVRKAARNALVNQRRGLRESDKATKMEIDTETQKARQKTKSQAKKEEKDAASQKRRAVSGSGGGVRLKRGGGAKLMGRGGGKHGNKYQENLSPEEKRLKQQREAKAQKLMNLAQKAIESGVVNKGNANRNKNAPPTKKAIQAASDAMALAGYNAPEGMKIVVNFVPIKENQNRGGGRGGDRNQRSDGVGGRGGYRYSNSDRRETDKRDNWNNSRNDNRGNWGESRDERRGFRNRNTPGDRFLDR